MIHLPASVRVYLCLTPCDMRKSFDSLHALVREHLDLDPFAGHLFVFTSRRKDRVKILASSEKFVGHLRPNGRRKLGSSSPKNAIPDSAASGFPVRSQLPFELVFLSGKRYAVGKDQSRPILIIERFAST